MYVPLFEKRSTIVNGQYEPTDEESQWVSDDEEELATSLKENAKIEETNGKEENKIDNNVKGIPEFWLTIFRNCSMLSEMVQPHDVPILNHLLDIKTICKEEPMVRTLAIDYTFIC